MKSFTHQQTAHCESGVLSTLLTQNGQPISEPMVFGITASLSFFFFPLLKLNNMPLISYRETPKNMIKKLPKILDISMTCQKYSNAIDANNALTALINQGYAIGLQTSVFYLPYFPKDMRFHFNAHNLIVFDKQGEDYLISDPVFEEIQKCHESDLTRARFAKGIFAPQGFLYYFNQQPQHIDFHKVIKKAIRTNAKKMLTPFPYAGINGMKKLAKKIASLNPEQYSSRYITNYLTHIVRMQEEIGTGGGGFRYLYAAFLQEAKEYGIENQKLDDAIQLLTDSGDGLRKMALQCVQNCKNPHQRDHVAISNSLLNIAEIEKKAFSILKNI